MMTGRLYIDGQDVYEEFGMYVAESGWNELIAMPPLKSVDSNDWQEEDGIEVDLSKPVLNSKDVNISFEISGMYNDYPGFIALLSDGAYHTFNCSSIMRTYTLRMVSLGNYDYAQTLGFVKLKFANDFPFLLRETEYLPPASSIFSSEDYLIDGVRLSDYGVRVLSGAVSEIRKTSDVKTAMLRNISIIPGAIYDSDVNYDVKYKSKDVDIPCLMRAGTLTELWRNWDALLYDLIRPGERVLYVSEVDHEFPCFYSGCRVSEFYPNDRIWLRFTLTLTFIRDFRISDGDLFLATEDGLYVNTETEDDEYVSLNII